MAKELSHRADELKGLGWSNDDVLRYAELWDYRQRWGAINLEREDRQFLRKAESALPKIVSGKVVAKKPLHEKSYYRWLRFYLDAMDKAEIKLGVSSGSRGIWPILIEEELRVLDYYQPVLGLPDTLKAKRFDSLRESIVERAKTANENVELLKFDFLEPLELLRAKESTNWRPLKEDSTKGNYPVLSSTEVEGFRKEVRDELTVTIRETLPSLVDSEKPIPPDDWSLD